MAIKLTITTEGAPGSQYVRSFMQDRIVIGRSRSADVCLPAMAVSARHAEIKIVGTDFALVDLDSLNGTSVNQKPVLPFRNRILKDGDLIAIADFTLHFQTGVAAAATEARNTAIQQARDILANVLARSGQSLDTQSLYVVTGPSRGTRIELKKGMKKVVIGRGKGVDLFLDDPDVSREHAEIVVEEAGVFIRDLRSRNGVVIDGKRVDAVKLSVGDQFTLGGSNIAMEHPAEKTLGLIFEAPEEDTSSFVLLKERPSTPALTPGGTPAPVSPRQTPVPPDTVSTKKSADGAPSSPKPAIGPRDPLVAPPTDGRTTGRHALSEQEAAALRKGRPKSDIGLIIVGAVILAAAVGGLIYLFQ